MKATKVTAITQFRDRKPTLQAKSLFELERIISERLRNRGEMSLRQLSEETGISHTYINNVEHGKSVCIRVLNRLANYYGICYEIRNHEENDNFLH